MSAFLQTWIETVRIWLGVRSGSPPFERLLARALARDELTVDVELLERALRGSGGASNFHQRRR